MKAQFILEWTLFNRNLKNQVMFVLFLFMTVYYALVVVPTYEPVRGIDIESIEAQVADSEYIEENYSIEQYEHTVILYSELNEVNQALLQALEVEDYDQVIELEPQQYALNLARFDGNDPNFYEYGQSEYDRDQEITFQTRYTHDRFAQYSEREIDLDLNVIEERTVTQTVQRMLEGWLPHVLLALLVFYSVDLLTKDKSHSTILSGLPSSFNKQLWIKTMVVITAYMITLTVAFGLFALIVGSQYGMGSLRIPIPVYGYDFMIGDFRAYTTMGKFLFHGVGLLLGLSFLYVRSIILLSLLFRHEFLNLAIGLPTIMMSELWNRWGVGWFNETLTMIPPTYVNIGSALTGRINHIYGTALVTFETGMLSLVAFCAFVELLIFGLTRLKRFRTI